MNAADVMSEHVITVTPDTAIFDAVRSMLRYGISGLPVVNDAGTLVGMLSESDLLRRAETGTEKRRPRWLEILAGPGRVASDYVQSHARKVHEVMNHKVVSVPPYMPLREVVDQMERHCIKRVPVVQDGKVIGIVSRANLMHALLAVADNVPEIKQSDSDIRAAIWEQLRSNRWAPVGLTNVFVQDGIVTLHGVVFQENEREALHVMVENQPGVKGVVDRLMPGRYLAGTVI